MVPHAPQLVLSVWRLRHAPAQRDNPAELFAAYPRQCWLERGCPRTSVEHPAPPCPVDVPVVEIRALGGAYAKEPAVRSALCHRDAPFNLNIVGLLVDEDAAQSVTAVVDATLGALAPWSAGAMLPNFAASDDPELIRTCYDADTAAWLAALGDQFDPHGVYRTGQVVRS